MPFKTGDPIFGDSKMKIISGLFAARAAFIVGLVGALSSCSSTDLASNSNSGSQTFALAATMPATSTASLLDAQKARQEEQKKKLASDQQKQKAAALKRQQLAAKAKLDREAKRLAAFDKMTAALSEQQKELMKPQRDLIVKSQDAAKTELAKLTPQPVAGAGSGGSRYHSLIAQHARANGVPLKLAHAVVRVESAYRANARGGAGEIGLMQLKLSTARLMGYKGSAKGLYNPEINIRYGMMYLGKAHKLAGGSTCGTILKYNAGHGAKRMNPISQRYCNKVARYI